MALNLNCNADTGAAIEATIAATELKSDKWKRVNFNDRKTLLDLIEYPRNASPGYGIVNILDNFSEERLQNA